MSKKIQLTIPKPCHENWDDMTPVEKGKFCGSCQKQVVDFSNMSDRQVAQFFKKPSTGSVCGRFMVDQLERDIEIPKKRIPWFKYFFQFALPAFLYSFKASAEKKQGNIEVRKNIGDTIVRPYYPKMGLVAPDYRKPVKVEKLSGQLELRVYDENRNPIQYASVQTGVIGKGGVTDKAGVFKMDKSSLNINGNIVVSAGRYERRVVSVRSVSIAQTVSITLQKKGWMENNLTTVCNPQPKVVICPFKPATINGVVLDNIGNPLPKATVQLIGSNIVVATDEKGNFKIGYPVQKEKCTLMASYIGYEPHGIEIEIGHLKSPVVFQLQKPVMMLGVIAVVAKPNKNPKNIPLMPANNKTEISAFKVFPNPVEAGTELNIEWKKPEEGYYSLSILNEAGQAVHKQELWIDAEAKILNIDAPVVPAGIYLASFTNRKTGRVYTEKIIIR